MNNSGKNIKFYDLKIIRINLFIYKYLAMLFTITKAINKQHHKK
ncbi:hypothetical protein P20311_2909 [Pseudoalteromonas sp. BSi20311]|nr:hypothetical protein P20311_2909 [Pseudoalteromonas sp. BSi20311]GAA71361.1 hypothetical protein P20439_1434 [Pseudoalteromonas sp. BSi20439]